MLVDSHCHLADPAFASDLTDVVGRARSAGLGTAMCIIAAEDDAELERAAAVSEAWSEVVFAAAVHPHKAGDFATRPPGAADVTARAVDRLGAVAIGEIGLDYHYDFAPRSVQQAVFASQIDLAVRRNRPVVIHTREAGADTFALLAAASAVRGVMHCFSGSVDEARSALDLGLYISLSGIVTFPKAEALRDVARFLPDDRLLVETDAPFLAPVPFRGKRNEPAWAARTLEVVAGLRGVTPEILGERVTRNFQALVR